MEKDFHYYAVFALALEAKFPVNSASQIAHASQFVDDCDDVSKEMEMSEIFGYTRKPIITQNNDFCIDENTQQYVYMPFHFVPGDNTEKPTVTTPASTKICALINNAIYTHNFIGLGIAVHALVDSFSHQNFSGYLEDVNSVYDWKHMFRAVIPNIGHADAMHLPDKIEEVWKDCRLPGNERRISNKIRAKEAILNCSEAFRCFRYCKKYSYHDIAPTLLPDFFRSWLNINEYDDRIYAIQKEYNIEKYNKNYFYNKTMYSQFQNSALKHLSLVLSII